MWPERNMTRTEFSEHSRVKLSVKTIFLLIKKTIFFFKYLGKDVCSSNSFLSAGVFGFSPS